MSFYTKLKLYLSGKLVEKDFEHEKPENWVWGIFYFNKKDYRFIVPKRNAMMGWTFNFAHPISFIVLILILVMAFFPRIFGK